MSHSYGAILCDDGKIYHVEYNGTVDVLLSNLYDTIEEVDLNWRKQEWKVCTCNPKQYEKAEVAVTYGGGFSWEIEICRICKVITDNWQPHEYENKVVITDKLPSWYPMSDEMKKYFDWENK